MRPLARLPANLSTLAACALAPWLAACTGEASFELPSIDAGAPSARYATACAAWASHHCAYADRCMVSVVARWEDDAQCLERETLLCELQASDPNVSFDPGRVEACTFSANCADDVGIFPAPFSPSLCLPAGKARAGAACVWNSACQSGNCVYTFDADDSEGACGKCEPQVTCACAANANQRCVRGDGGIECVTLPDAGEPCGSPLYACNGAQCVSPGDSPDGTCRIVPMAGIGMPCTTTAAGPQCSIANDLAYCDHTNHCRAYEPATYGEACVLSTGGEGNLCLGDGWCDSRSTGTCQPPVLDGEPCEYPELPCLSPARCLGGACVFPTLATCAGP